GTALTYTSRMTKPTNAEQSSPWRLTPPERCGVPIHSSIYLYKAAVFSWLGATPNTSAYPSSNRFPVRTSLREVVASVRIVPFAVTVLFGGRAFLRVRQLVNKKMDNEKHPNKDTRIYFMVSSADNRELIYVIMPKNRPISYLCTMVIKTATFVSSNTRVDKLPAARLPEYAFIGRSNVGKSSLINALTGNRHLAK